MKTGLKRMAVEMDDKRGVKLQAISFAPRTVVSQESLKDKYMRIERAWMVSDGQSVGLS